MGGELILPVVADFDALSKKWWICEVELTRL